MLRRSGVAGICFVGWLVSAGALSSGCSLALEPVWYADVAPAADLAVADASQGDAPDVRFDAAPSDVLDETIDGDVAAPTDGAGGDALTGDAVVLDVSPVDVVTPSIHNLVFATSGCTMDGTPCPTTAVFGGGGTYIVRIPLLAEDIDVQTGVTVRPTAFLGSASGGGRLQLTATSLLHVAAGARLDASGLGFGGGGGGGGGVYADPRFCSAGITSSGGPTGGTSIDGSAGLAPITGLGAGMDWCFRQGGEGAGQGGAPGALGNAGGPGAGGGGGGPYGGAGGLAPVPNGFCSGVMTLLPEASGNSGRPGGYMAAGVNGDLAPDGDDLVTLGSGGGGGSGGQASSGYCCGGGVGGAGGVHGAGPVSRSCDGGGGGSGGGAGGGTIELVSQDIQLEGALFANGGGDALLGAGFGAGGGILVVASGTLSVASSAAISSLGGDPLLNAVFLNGGTVKIRYHAYGGSALLPSIIGAGRSSIVMR